MNHILPNFQDILEFVTPTLENASLGCLVGSVGRACDSRSRSCEFETCVGYRDDLKIKILGVPGWHSG